MDKSNFDMLMRRYLENKVSEEERIKIETWMDVRKTEDTGDRELSREDAEKIFQKIISKESTPAEVRELTSVKGDRNAMWWTYRIAAGILVVCLIGYIGWMQGFRDGGVTEVASAGSTEKTILRDGSLVWLKGQSHLTYYNKYDEGIRYAELKGEALFEVAKDASHPFIIQCGEVKLKVLGTSFSVRALNDSIELRVLTGKVNFSTAMNASGIDVIPNEKVLYGGGRSIAKVSMVETDAHEVVADTEYSMAFVGSHLSDVLSRLEKKFDVRFKIENEKASSCLVTLDITDHSLEKSLEILSDVLNITWKQEGRIITVSGNGC